MDNNHEMDNHMMASLVAHITFAEVSESLASSGEMTMEQFLVLAELQQELDPSNMDFFESVLLKHSPLARFLWEMKQSE